MLQPLEVIFLEGLASEGESDVEDSGTSVASTSTERYPLHPKVKVMLKIVVCQ